MGIWITVILFLVGIILIVKGGDFFVDAAAWMAEISGIPKLIIGATIVSVATTLPEMLVSVFAALQGKVDMSVGNAVGSVTANIGLIMAISLLFIPAVIRRKDYLLKSVLMLLAAALIAVGGFVGEINGIITTLLLIIFVIFIYENIRGAKDSENNDGADEKPEFTKKDIFSNIVKFIIGAAGIIIGADLLVDNGSEIARLLGISERIIAVTIVAIGTSLPELVTTITAIAKKHSSLSVGNILGANIMDLTLILPVCSILSGKPLPISSSSAVLDLPIALIVGLAALVPALIMSKYKRWQGVLLIVIYIAYVAVTCSVIA